MPSQIMKDGDTLDVFIINAAIDIHKWLAECEEAKAQGKPRPPKRMSKEQMMDMLERVRNNANKKNK